MKTKKEVRTFSFRIPEEMLEKFRYVAAYDCRSVSGAVRVVMENHVRQFEREHGEIKL